MVKGNPQTEKIIRKRIGRLQLLIGKHVLWFFAGVAIIFFGLRYTYELGDTIIAVSLGAAVCLVSVRMCIRATLEIIFVLKELKVSQQE